VVFYKNKLNSTVMTKYTITSTNFSHQKSHDLCEDPNIL
jgi:hypothetical protein